MGWDLALQSASAVTKGGFAYHRVSKTEYRWKKLMKQNIKRKLKLKTHQKFLNMNLDFSQPQHQSQKGIIILALISYGKILKNFWFLILFFLFKKKEHSIEIIILIALAALVFAVLALPSAVVTRLSSACTACVFADVAVTALSAVCR